MIPMRSKQIFLFFLFTWTLCFAQTTRKFVPLTEEKKETQPLFASVERGAIEKALRSILGSWNTPEFSKYLSQNFYDRERLMRSIEDKVPKDARLRLLALQEVKLLDQKREKNQVTYIVSANVRTSLEFEDPGKGFQSLVGENELILKISVQK